MDYWCNVMKTKSKTLKTIDCCCNVMKPKQKRRKQQTVVVMSWKQNKKR